LATIRAIDESSVQLDMNHPLAGKELTFNIEVVEVQTLTTASSATVTMLEGLKVPELRAVAKERGLKGYTKLKKAELLDLLGA
jgi:FKBP-type peptidyl-prolyl cis-trans isomerase 2